MKTSSIGKRDAVRERSSSQSDIASEPEHIWDHTRQPAATDDSDIELRDDEQDALSGHSHSSDEAQLQELMSAWSRASDEARRRFLASINASHTVQAASFGPTEPVPSQQLNQTQEIDGSQSGVSSAEPQENALYEMWKDFKPNTQICGRQWVADNCPPPNPSEHFIVTESLVPFRATAKTASQQERDDFLELTRTP
jgi:hypothetical protein